MKTSALNVLVCPSCKYELRLTIDERDGKEVISGALHCDACEAQFPVVLGVPRFVNAEKYAASFGRQWNWFRKVQIDSLNGTRESDRALFGATGWPDDVYRDALLLDAGVGAGRFAECAARKGAEVFGVDLSEAIDAAYANIGRLDNVHLVQADIFAMPFRDAAFDLAYSIGVLHHTPDTRGAFDRVASTVKSGGKLAVYLYDRHNLSCHFTDFWRRITTKLPHRVMAMLTTAAIPLYYLYRIPVLGRLFDLVLPISKDPDWRWRWLDTFDWYTPKYQWKFLYPEVFKWFHEDGFRDVRIFDGPIRMSATKAGA